jgi:hypothetical protein
VLLHQLRAVLKVMISCSDAWRYCDDSPAKQWSTARRCPRGFDIMR